MNHMQHTKKWMAWIGAGAVVLVSAAGCSHSDEADPSGADANRSQAMSNEAAGTSNVVSNAGAAASNVGEAAANTVSNAGSAMSNVASNAGTAMSNMANSAGNHLSSAGTALVMTPKIKTALGAAPALHGSTINVDTLPGNKIALRGAVRSAAQKTLAERIAKQNAPGMTIVNQLTVGH